jgi:DNA-binding NarL/FixJ family response regulator
MATVSVLLADDHAMVAEGLSALLKDSFTLIGTVPDGRALLAAAAELRPDVIVADISMPLLNGLDAIRQIRSKQPGAKIVVLTMHAESELAVEAFRAGASAYVLKTCAGEELVFAIREVSQGRFYVSSSIAKDFIGILIEARKPATPGNATLTARQREVLQLVAEGRTMKETASILNISQRTAESHKYEIMRLLGVETTAALVQYAIRLKLVPMNERP